MVEFEAGGVNPVVQALPPVIVVRSEDQNTSAELHALARLMLVEYEAGAAGRQGVLDRLAEVMFVLVLRHHMQRAPELKGFLAALKDERIARALAALHRTPGADWRVETLAREAGMSRTVFAERFAGLLGQTPMQYLAELAHAPCRRDASSTGLVGGADRGTGRVSNRDGVSPRVQTRARCRAGRCATQSAGCRS